MLESLLEALENKNLKPIEPGLERILIALERLGNPQNRIPKTIHVAGTNGKGSTIAFLRSILQTAGFSCHAYTSPHLVKFNERIVIANHEIRDDYLEELIERYNRICGDLDLTFFESTTAIAFMAFEENKADYLLLEVGLGGRWDATNVITPALTIITPISMDHMEYLGETIELIAAEKAAIIKTGIPCVSAPQKPEVAAVIKSAAKETNSPLYTSSFFSGTPSLPGAHQHINAGTAGLAAEILGIDTQIINKGIATATWPARLQQIKQADTRYNLPANAEVWLDGAHNQDGAKSLNQFIHDNFNARPIYLITGMLANKDLEGFYRELTVPLQQVIVLKVKGGNSANPDIILGICTRLNIENRPAEGLQEAFDIINQQNSQFPVVIIAGSLYLAGMLLS